MGTPQSLARLGGAGGSPLDLERTDDYPHVGGDFVLEAALAQLAAVDSQANALDQKLGTVAAVSGALIALLAALVAAPAEGALSVELARTEIAGGAAAVGMFVVALAHCATGLWPQEFDLGPALSVVRDQLQNGFYESDVKWAMVTSVDRSIALNRQLLRPKVGALQLGFAATTTGVGVSLFAAVWHISR